MPQSQSENERLITALQQVGGLSTDIRLLREDLKDMGANVENLTHQIIRIETEAKTNRTDSRLVEVERRLQILELEEGKRVGGKESGANIYKYSTGILALLLTALGIAIAAYFKTR